MVNLSLLASLLLILIFQDIIILNEETLILLCFILFNWLVYSNYKFTLNQNLQLRSTLIEKELIHSLKTNYLNLTIVASKQQNLKNLKLIFLHLKQHIIKFNSYFLSSFPRYQQQTYQISILKKLIFTKNIEGQTFKLILLLLLKKIEKLENLNFFYINKLNISYFKTFSKISNKEYFKLIK